jgi:hypothetical protein
LILTKVSHMPGIDYRYNLNPWGMNASRIQE